MLKFGTSGIRDLTSNLLKKHVAKEIAESLYTVGWQEVSIARDGRTGSDKLMDEFVKYFPGIIHNLGITTTPELAAQNGLAVMITASHNPCEYCGFKIYLNHIERNTLNLPPVPPYHKWDLLPKNIVIDCANGGLGHKLHSLGFTNIVNYGDGEINQGCGATHPEYLSEYCQKNNLEIGFAVDGDADRFMMYLHDHVLSSEEVTILLATLLNLKTIVIDETVNSGLERNFQIVRSKVGGQSVLQFMRDAHVMLGAEKSGHYYFETSNSSSDALDAIILVTNAYKEKGLAGLQAILDTYRPYHQICKNIKIENLPEDYKTIIANFAPRNLRKVIRKSGTEPILRIMLESKKEKVLTKAWQTLATQLKIEA